MKNLLRMASGTLLIAVIIVLALTQTANAENPQKSPLPLSPLSGGALMAMAVHSGRVVPQSGGPAPKLGCIPPCLYPELQASSNGPMPVNETPIIVDHNNNTALLTGGNDYNCGSVQGFYFSTDKGNTWSPGNNSCMPTLPGYSGAGDPAVGYDLNSNAYRAGIDIGSQWVIVFQTSADHGLTWGPIPPSIAVTPLFSGGLTDKDWMQVDTTPSSPFANCIYVSVTQFDSGGFNGAIGVAHSCDGGASWTDKQASPHSTGSTVIQFSDLAIAKDGTVYVSWLECPATSPQGDCGGQASKLFISKSTDGGNTWNAPSLIANVTLAPDTCGAFYGCLPGTSERVSDIPVIDVDRSGGAHNGRIYALFYNWTGTFMQVLATYSDNGGVMWIPAKSVAGALQTHDQFFPWLSVSANGAVAATWLDRRLDPANHNYNAFGATYNFANCNCLSANVKLTALSPSNPNMDGFGGGFMGDYTGNFWADPGSVFMSYCATRTGTCQDWIVGGMP